jgi:hypothetical protein
MAEVNRRFGTAAGGFNTQPIPISSALFFPAAGQQQLHR